MEPKKYVLSYDRVWEATYAAAFVASFNRHKVPGVTVEAALYNPDHAELAAMVADEAVKKLQERFK
jgi:hypothetical protein